MKSEIIIECFEELDQDEIKALKTFLDTHETIKGKWDCLTNPVKSISNKSNSDIGTIATRAPFKAKMIPFGAANGTPVWFLADKEDNWVMQVISLDGETTAKTIAELLNIGINDKKFVKAISDMELICIREDYDDLDEDERLEDAEIKGYNRAIKEILFKHRLLKEENANA